PMLKTKPSVTLGPCYVVRYVMPGPGAASVLQQDLYPYANPYPMSYTKPGQVFWDGQRTFGGWYQSSPELKQTLAAVGLPAHAPSGSGGDQGFWSSTPQLIAVFGSVAAAALAVVAVAVIARRRRIKPATVQWREPWPP